MVPFRGWYRGSAPTVSRGCRGSHCWWSAPPRPVAPEIEHATFPAASVQIQKLLDLGVPLLACPGCLEAAGKSAADLRLGVQVASKDAFFDFTEGRILTLDY